MPGVEPDEEICEMIMRTTSQEALSGLKRGLIALFAGGLNGSEVAGQTALVRAEIDSAGFDAFMQKCKESGIELNVVDLSIEKKTTVFEFRADKLDEVKRIADGMIEEKLIAEPLKVQGIDDAKEDLENLISLLKNQGIDLSARTDEQGCAEFSIKAKSWDDMAHGFAAAAVASGEPAPSYISIPVSDDLLGLLKTTKNESTPFRANVSRSDNGEAALVINANELGNVEARLEEISAHAQDANINASQEAQRMQQHLASIRKSLEDARSRTLDETIASAKDANLAAEKNGSFVKDRNRQVERVR